MESNELRVNNLFTYKGNVIKIDEFPEVVILLSSLEPILLTEEWLVKFGFTKNLHYWVKSFEYLGDLKIRESREWFSNKFIGYFLALNDLEINYVHQLQNLYFGLSQKELTFK